MKNTSNLIEPGAIGALAYGWRKMIANFLVFFLVVLVLSVFEAVLDGGQVTATIPSSEGSVTSLFLGFLLFAYWLLFLPVINYGADLIFLRGVRGDDVEIKSLVSGFYKYLNVVLAALLVFGLVGIALIVFIIPGIYVGCRLAFVSYLVMDEGLDPVEAVEGSWRITRGHAWSIFSLGFISILLFTVGFLMLFVGVFPAVMWAKASFAAMYLSITQQNSEDAEYDESDHFEHE